MKNWWKHLIILIGGCIAGYYLTISLLPNFIYAGAQKKILSRPGTEINKLAISPIVDASLRAVVMPNPDFIYLTSFYDLSEGGLRLHGLMPDSTYWSVAMYHPNTINWFVKNDMEFGQDNLDLKIQHDSTLTSNNSEDIVHSSKEKGFLLIRVLLTDRTDEKVKALRSMLAKVKLEKI